MSMQDPISDLLSGIKNAQARMKRNVVFNSSSKKLQLLSLLQKEGYIESFEIKEENKVTATRARFIAHAAKTITTP